MTSLTEIIEAFHMKANCHYNPSMDGTRDAYMEGRKEAYLDCANILEKWRNSINEKELDELAWYEAFKKYDVHSETENIIQHRDGYTEGFKSGYRKAIGE